MDYIIWLQILNELALAVSGERNIDNLYLKASKTFMRKLDATSFIIIVEKDGNTKIDYISPKVLTNKEKIFAVYEEFFKMGNGNPLILKYGEIYYYKFNLKEYGSLIITKTTKIEKKLLNELKPIIDMFSVNILGCIANIKQKEIEVVLRNERTFLNKLINAIPDAIIYKDISRKYALVNKAAAESIGKEVEEIINHSDEDVHPEEAVKFFREKDMEVLDKRETLNYEYEYLDPIGKKIFYEAFLTPLISEKDEILGLIGISRDITNRKQIEAIVDKQIEFQKLLIELALSFINIDTGEVDISIEETLRKVGSYLEVDRVYVIEYDNKNRQISNEYKWSNKSRKIDITLEKRKDFCSYFYEKYLVYKDVIIDNVENLNSSSKTYEYLKNIKSFLAIPMNYKDGFIGFIAVEMIDGYKDWNFEEISLIRVLSEMITNIIINKKRELVIIDAKKNAEFANSSKTMFLANMSHEIRTPINSIMGFLELLKYTELDYEQNEMIKEIKNASESLLRVINDILDISKVEAGKLSLEKIEFSLHKTVQDVVNLFLPKAQEKKLTITVNIDKDVSENVIGDSTRLKQILSNLLGNAVKFTTNGMIDIKVYRKNEENFTYFEVLDTGIGIDEMVLEKLFSPFIQEDSTTTRKFGGTGLGLAISKELVHMMSGEIWVESKKDIGSKFIFYIELEKRAEKNEKTKNENIIEKPIGFNMERVLVVDDNSANRMVVSKILRNNNLYCDTVSNGKEAYSAFITNEYDIILMDCQMPELDGYEATKYIREVQKKHIPIIAMTANAMSGDKEKCIASGMDDYISKPIDYKLLMILISKYLEREVIISMEENDIKYIDEYMTRFIKDTGLSEEDSKEIFEEFSSSFDEAMDRIRESYKNEDFPQLSKIAHKIKGSAGNLRIESIYDLALELENSSREDNRELTLELINKLVNKRLNK